MAFIKAQKIIYDESGKITSGSASVVDTIYGNASHPCAIVTAKGW